MSNLLGPELTDILSSLAAMGALVALLRMSPVQFGGVFWKTRKQLAP